MKTASKLLSIAFAVAAVAAVAMPSAKSAEAASGPDLEVTIWNVQAGADTKVHVWGKIKNIGNVTSQPIVIESYCGYWLDKDGVKQVAAEQVTSKPGLAPNAAYDNFDADFYCSEWNGHMPIYYRLIAITSGDTNTANNDAHKLAFAQGW